MFFVKVTTKDLRTARFNGVVLTVGLTKGDKSALITVC
jgi:hypothetical protein